MDARPNTRRVDREGRPTAPQAPRGARQIVIPMTREQYGQLWHDPARLREHVDDFLQRAPECFPAAFARGYHLRGYGRESRKLPGVRLRKVVLADGSAYWLRPSFALPYMTGTVDDLAYPLLLLAHGVPAWLLTVGFGHGDMYWHRLLERLGRNSLVGTTVRDPARLPEHLAADEHHVDWAGEKGYVAMTTGGGCVLGVALTPAADEAHLTEAYGEFAAEIRDVDPDHAPRTVNADGWAATHNTFGHLFSGIAVVLCFLHGFLKIRERGRKLHDLHARVWEVYRARTAGDFRRLMQGLRRWCDHRVWTASVRSMLEKLFDHTEEYAAAYEHPGCHRTSNAVDRPMNRLKRLAYAGRGLHGHRHTSTWRLRGWALLQNFRPFAPRSNVTRAHDSPAHRLNDRRYHEHWLHNLMTATSLMGHRNREPAIR